jgi:triacylglycerol lipase
MRYSLTADSMEPAPIARRPSLVNSLFEFRFPVEAAALFWSYAIHHPRPHIDDSNRKTVMMIPGFMAGDLTLAPLAKFCEWLGHKTFFTGIWSNSRCPREMVLHLERNLEEIHASFGRVVIIGHSLGGMYALELGVRRPDLIERVITLGSPVRSAQNSCHAFILATARLISILRGMDHGCLTPSCACIMDLMEGHPEVPTTAMYSRTDGVVHWESCVDRSGVTTVENIEVTGSHVGMAVNAGVYRVVADRLAMPPREQRLRCSASEATPATEGVSPPPFVGQPNVLEEHAREGRAMNFLQRLRGARNNTIQAPPSTGIEAPQLTL